MKQMIKSFSGKKVVMFMGLMLFTTVYVLIFSWSTSIFYDNYNVTSLDSGVFMSMGKLAKDGMIPYKEMFDHKGPFMVLVQTIGMMISDGKLGIFIVQILFLTVSMCGVYKILRLFYTQKKSAVFTIMSFLVLNIYFEGGNLTEEYCLSFLLWSTYFAVKYIKNSKLDEEHNPLYSLFYGITFTVCAFTRITNSFPLCCIVVCGFILLIKRRRWRDILKNIFCFFIGMIGMMIPFLIYFWANDALYDMIYATFIYNFRYAGSDTGQLSILETLKAMKVALTPIVGVGIVGICAMITRKGNSIINSYIILSSIIAMLFQLKSNPYAHYLMVWLPLIVVSIGVAGKVIETKNGMKNVAVSILVLCVIIVIAKNGLLLVDTYRIYQDDTGKSYKEEVQYIVEQIELENKNKVIAYNVSPYFYLLSDIKPCYKHFVLQDWESSMDREMYCQIENEIGSLKAQYIVVEVGKENNFDSLIVENYNKILETESLLLMKLK